MADQRGLKLIGWMLGGITAVVMLVAALLVHDAVATPTASQPASISGNMR
jgi:hypothetical protein